eukprot:4030782-Lingulodinium_polyedra.AAC.1
MLLSPALPSLVRAMHGESSSKDPPRVTRGVWRIGLDSDGVVPRLRNPSPGQLGYFRELNMMIRR